MVSAALSVETLETLAADHQRASARFSEMARDHVRREKRGHIDVEIACQRLAAENSATARMFLFALLTRAG